GWPEDEKGRAIGRYLPNDGTPSFYFQRLRHMIWRDRTSCYPALKQHCLSLRPDGTFWTGSDVKPAAAAVLRRLFNCDDEGVRNEAAFAIGIIGDRADTSSAIPGLAAMLKGSRAERLNAACALGELGHGAEAAIPALIEAGQSDDPKIREIAAQALQRIAPD